jgi:four helix bundle protein
MGQSYRDLVAWQKAMNFVMEVYRITKSFPRDEVYGLSSQLRRAAVAIPTNIAEGQARFSANDFFYFLGRGRGALVEVETQLMIAQNLSYFSPEQGQQLLDKAAEVGKILNGLIASIRPAAQLGTENWKVGTGIILRQPCTRFFSAFFWA